MWASVDHDGQLIKDANGRVEIVYKPEAGARVYRAGAANLVAAPGSDAVDFEAGAGADARPEPGSAGKAGRGSASSGSRAGGRSGAGAEVPANAIHVWTDGACSGNPGPAGLGVVIVGDGTGQREISEYLGEATNNIAELTAILRGLQAVSDRKRPVVVYSDSAYSIGLLSQNWKAKKNVELVKELRDVCKQFGDLRFVKVLAHSGIALNERVDQLAVGAISRRGNSDKIVA
ncbi:MAG TPA: ribonuclease H [Kofleriaceae bacterium]|nr:ribonuclease H [Kofleriaceae bacterium]